MVSDQPGQISGKLRYVEWTVKVLIHFTVPPLPFLISVDLDTIWTDRKMQRQTKYLSLISSDFWRLVHSSMKKS